MSQVEVQHHRLAFVRYQNVGGLQVSVEDPAFVSVGQSVGQAGRHPKNGFHVTQALEPLQNGRGPGSRFYGWRIDVPIL